MPIGPGKYDKACERARRDTGALGTLLIIIGGKHGSGFSVTTVEHAQQSVIASVPALLRKVADDIERDMTPRGSA